MSLKFKKGPNKLSLKYSQQLSQSTSHIEQRRTLSQPGSMESGDATKKEVCRSQSVPTGASEPDQPLREKPKEKNSLDFSTDSPLKLSEPDIMTSPEDVFKPTRSKRAKPAPDLTKLKNTTTEDISEKPSLSSDTDTVEKEPLVKRAKFEQLAAKLKSFEKAPVKKFPIKTSDEVKNEAENDDNQVEPVPSTSSTVDPQMPETRVPANANKELPCVVCNKYFKKNLRTHMKACAGKNGLTTEQLMRALELQRKQVEERKELGLPLYLQNKKSATSRKKNGVGAESDPNIQLALALSKSLKDAEEEAYLREARMIFENQEGMTESQVDATIQAVIQEPEPSTSTGGRQSTLTLGQEGTLVVQKSSAAGNATKSAINTKAAPFMTVSAEERLRRVTEKVAMYLLDEDVEEPFPKASALRQIDINKVLQEKLEKGADLWKLASKSPSTENKSYYVKGIREFVSPSKSNSGVLHLEPQEPEFRMLKEHKVKKQKAQARPSSSPVKQKDSSLSRDWASLLNSRTMSDILVYCKEDKEIRAHKLVLLVRCPSILKDLASEMSQDGATVKEEMLLWSEYSEGVVMAVLEFIYCDTTCKAMRLSDAELEDLDAISKRYEIAGLQTHLNMLRKLREEINQEDEMEKSPTPETPPAREAAVELVRKSKVEEKSRRSDGFRTELSFLISQMEKSIPSLVPTQSNHHSVQHPIIDLSASPESSTFKSPKADEMKEQTDENGNTSDEDDIFSRKSNVEKDETIIEKVQIDEEIVNTDDDLFASLDDSLFNKKYGKEEPTTNVNKSIEINEDRNDDWRGLNDPDFMNTTPAKSISSIVTTPIANRLSCIDELPNELISQIETSPFSSPVRLKNDTLPLEVVTLSSDASQKSALTLSPKAESPLTPEHHPLDDSFEVPDGELTHLELAALKAYEKVMTPMAASVATPGSSKITPIQNYSLMDSPQLKKELDKYGIKHLRRNQAKLILRHIYDELHPRVSSTPLARPPKRLAEKKTKQRNAAKMSPIKEKAQTQQAKAPKKSPAKKTAFRTPEKTQPVKSAPPPQATNEQGYDSFDELLFDLPKPGPSETQPVSQLSSNSESSGSDSSDNEGYGKYGGDDELEEVFTQVPETQTDVTEQIEEAMKSDPGLYHRILTFEPIWLEEIKDLLKENKVRVNPKVLLDYLDDQCITYRTEHQRPTKRATQKRGWTQSQRGRKK
ncbi:uncharacterized protein LOC132193610 [Neocloeon triangulifer]|uniref:uncharacterized protein LOC132193610 n=1 Tax=Neocloeon triangulifer TaxID=2078957 RepID=UPI00286EDF18|nr:uncharacterized protein LOC132193610 [Neocloeon triangulifer]XP_059470367.1 uncharacterized protein LOC132193610 [Neocloeon triangulifer]